MDAEIGRLLAESSWRRRLEGIDLVCGAGALTELGEVAAGFGAQRALVVTDEGIAAAGHLERAVAALSAAGIDCQTFDRVEENPTGETLEQGVASVGGASLDLVVGLGGGSAMDAAKGINLLLTNGGSIQQYEGFGRSRRPLLPAIGVPTTAGTGSEAQSYALISDSLTHRKMACGDPGLRFRAVVLDPELLVTVPAPTRAASGLDAVSHALESFVTTRRTDESIELARTAWNLLEGHLEAVLGKNGGDDAPWGPLQLAAFLAGAAIERSMLGAAHACANPLTARFGVVHGVAVALMLPAVIRFNGELDPDPYGGLEPSGAEGLARRVEALRAAGDLPAGLGEVGVARRDLAQLAEAASRQWTLSCNPRAASRDDLVRLYERSL
ncbi:MAG: iron-containing alcohol dehydrogenase [Thermoanaerobaculia bacterium]|nr:iron-containing alcohol dehydrogenase [Thermoanaerobaculia bacterium]